MDKESLNYLIIQIINTGKIQCLDYLFKNHKVLLFNVFRTSVRIVVLVLAF